MIGDWFLAYRDRVEVWFWPVLLLELIWLRARMITEASQHGPDTLLFFTITPTGRVTVRRVLAAPPAGPSRETLRLADALSPKAAPAPPLPVKALQTAWRPPVRAVAYLDSS